GPDGTVRQPLSEVETEPGQVVVDDRLAGYHGGLVPVDEVGDSVVDGQGGERNDQAPAAGVAAQGRESRRHRARRQHGRAWRDCGGIHVSYAEKSGAEGARSWRAPSAVCGAVTGETT